MKFHGCRDWNEFTVLANTSCPEPPHLLVAIAEPPASEGQQNFFAFWPCQQGYMFLSSFSGTKESRKQATIEFMDFKTVTNVFLKMGSPDRWNDYRKKSYTHELLDEANRLAANTGARIGWAVECSQESYGDFWTTTQAVYHDLDVAIAHVYGAIQYESARDVADDDIDYDGDPSWSLRDVMMRNTLPEHLAAYASGEKTAPHRPLILDEKGIYSLEVPERGRVIYSGCGAEAAAVAALCTLPNSKVSSTTRLKSQECRCIVDLTIQGFELNWKCQYDWGSLIPGHAIAEGMDKTNLVKQAFDAIQNAKEKSREQENQE